MNFITQTKVLEICVSHSFVTRTRTVTQNRSVAGYERQAWDFKNRQGFGKECL